MNAELISSVASAAVALAAMAFTTVLLSRQVRQMKHERNALAVLEAIERLTDPSIVELFTRLRGINERYPDDDANRCTAHGGKTRPGPQKIKITIPINSKVSSLRFR